MLNGLPKGILTLTKYKKPFKVKIHCLGGELYEAKYHGVYASCDTIIYEHEDKGLMIGVIIGRTLGRYSVRRLSAKQDRTYAQTSIEIYVSKIKCRLTKHH